MKILFIAPSARRMWETILLLFLSIFLFVGKGWALPSALPDLDGWTSGSLFSKELVDSSKSHGIWLQRTYLAPGGRRLEINLLSGPGAGDLYIPQKDVEKDDRPLGFGATYRSLTVGKYRALLEVYPHVGPALSVQLPQQTTLNLESKNLTEAELLDIAQHIISEIENDL